MNSLFEDIPLKENGLPINKYSVNNTIESQDLKTIAEKNESPELQESHKQLKDTIATNIEDYNKNKRKRRSVSFATTARMRCDSHSGEIALNPSFNENMNDSVRSKTNNASKHAEGTLDMHMSVGLSIIRKEMSDNSSVSLNSNKICHSTPLTSHPKSNKINCDAVTTKEEKNMKQNHANFSINVSVNDLRRGSTDNKSIKHLDNCQQEEENITASGMKVSKKTEGADKAKRKFSELEQENKVIQVSKSIFGASSETSSFALSRRKSKDLSTSYSYQERANDKVSKQRKSDFISSYSKREDEMDCTIESRSYHSNFLSTLESDSGCVPARKRVMFRNASTLDNTTTDYQSSTSDSSYYVSRNRKSVGFREAVSVIQTTNNGFLDGNIDNRILSNRLVNKSHFDDTNPSKEVLIERSSCPSITCAQVPQINSLTVNHNEMSKECSLFERMIKTTPECKIRKKTEKNKRNTFLKPLYYCKNLPKIYSSDYEPSKGIHIESWISPNLIKFLNNKLMNDNLDYVLNTERIVSILCSVVNAIKNLRNVNDIESTLLPLKSVLLTFGICSNMIEYCSFITRFTLFEFQKKVLPFGGYFGSVKLECDKKLSDPILTVEEKVEYDNIQELYFTES